MALLRRQLTTSHNQPGADKFNDAAEWREETVTIVHMANTHASILNTCEDWISLMRVVQRTDVLSRRLFIPAMFYVWISIFRARNLHPGTANATTSQHSTHNTTHPHPPT